MNLIRWDPFPDADTLFNRLMPGAFLRWPRLAHEGTSGGKLEWSPSADISETDQEYLIRAELPAVKKEDVQVTFDDGTISIKGERKQQKSDRTEKYHRVETFYGSFERTFALPENIDVDAISCDSKDGILSVHIPKTQTQKSKPKQISVQ